MSAKRMISDTVTGTDAFIEMPLSAQALFFHLVLQGDPKGFFGSAVKTIRSIGASQEDMQILIDKGYIIRFKSGVCCIRHWNMMNNLKTERAKSDFPEVKLVRLDGGVYKTEEE